MNPHPPQNDHLSRLVRRMKNGDREAASALYDELLPPVYDFFFLHTGETRTAEELSEKIFFTLIGAVAEFDEKETSATTWFWSMVNETMLGHDPEWAGALMPG